MSSLEEPTPFDVALLWRIGLRAALGSFLRHQSYSEQLINLL